MRRCPVIRDRFGRVLGVHSWASGAAREGLMLCRMRATDTNAATLHARLNATIAALRSGSRRKTYRWLRASLRQHRSFAAMRMEKI